MNTTRHANPAEAFWRLAYPEQCVLCSALLGLHERYLCGPCRARLPWTGSPTCPRCGGRVALDTVAPRGCGACWGRRFAFTRAVSPFRYDGAVRDLLLRFKLAREAWLAYLLGGLLADHLATGDVARLVDLIAPVPLHWRRRLRRGFNQAHLLALEIGAAFGLPVARGLLRRTRPTTTQTAFSRLRRDANVRGAFVVRTHSPLGGALSRVRAALGSRHDVHGKRILLVDDILTTGSTANECARTLRHAGASEVLVATVARAVR